MAKIDFYTLPVGTTPVAAGLGGTPPAGKQYRQHIYPGGQVVWAIVDIGVQDIRWPASKTITTLKPETPQTLATSQYQASGTSTGFFNSSQSSIVQPNWSLLATSNGWKVPDFLAKQSGTQLNITPVISGFGKLGSTGADFWSSIQNLVVDPITKKTDSAAVELVSNWFGTITKSQDVYGLIKSRLLNQSGAVNTTTTTNFNQVLNGVVKLLADPASGGNMGSISPGALTYKPSGGTGSKATVVITPATGNNPSLIGQSTASASTQANAFTNIENELQSWGMDSGSLVNRLKKLVFTTGDHVVSTGQLNDWLKSQPEYEAAFPGLAKYNDTAAKTGQ